MGAFVARGALDAVGTWPHADGEMAATGTGFTDLASVTSLLLDLLYIWAFAFGAPAACPLPAGHYTRPLSMTSALYLLCKNCLYAAVEDRESICQLHRGCCTEAATPEHTLLVVPQTGGVCIEWAAVVGVCGAVEYAGHTLASQST
jgi:hypothetical protein